MNSQLPDFAAAAEAGQLNFVRKNIDGIMRLTRLPDSEPWWGKTAQSRFDDPRREFGVSYVADTLETAFAETVIHEAAYFLSGAWFTPWEKIDERWLVRYSSPATLTLLDLTGAALKCLGLNNDISSTDDYTFTQALSRSVHDQVPQVDGIYYVSRQLNTQCAMAMFQRSAIECAGHRTKLTRHPNFPKLMKTLQIEIA